MPESIFLRAYMRHGQVGESGLYDLHQYDDMEYDSVPIPIKLVAYVRGSS